MKDTFAFSSSHIFTRFFRLKRTRVSKLRWIWNGSYLRHCTCYTNLNRKRIYERCFRIFIMSHFHEIFCPLVFELFWAKLDTICTSNLDSILQGDLSNSKSIWHLSLKFDALWCRVCSAKIRAIFPANYFSKPGVQINFSVMTNPRKLSLLCCCRSSRLTWRPEARRYKRSLNLKDKF